MNLTRLHKIYKRRIALPVLRRFHPEVEVAAGDRRLRVDLRDGVIGRLLYLRQDYEREALNLIGQMDLQGAVCLDIGANIGTHTLAMSERVGESGQVFAFEPETHNFQLLETNLRLNKIKNVTAERCAVGEAAGSCRLALNPNNYGDHRVVQSSRSNGALAQETLMITIDQRLESLPDGAIKLIKIDVQGHECCVLRGMAATLRRNPDALLLIEVFPEGLQAAGASAGELVQALLDLGMTGWEFHDDRINPLAAEAWVYDLIRYGRHVDLILSRNPERLRTVLSSFYGRQLPQLPARPLPLASYSARGGQCL